MTFSEGRLKGQRLGFRVEDINTISRTQIETEKLVQMSKHKVAVRDDSAGKVVNFQAGNFVVLDTPSRKVWVAQLLEPYAGRVSDEVRICAAFSASALPL